MNPVCIADRVHPGLCSAWSALMHLQTVFNEYKLDAWLRLADRLCLLPVELDSEEEDVKGTACSPPACGIPFFPCSSADTPSSRSKRRRPFRMASMSGISEVDTPDAYRLSERAVRPADINGRWREEDSMFSFSSLGGLAPTVTR